MGSYDGAETCELVGLFILDKLSTKFGSDVGLYRDDGLAAIKSTPQAIERKKKELCKTFNEIGLKITVEANMITTNYLDTTLNLEKESYHPYMKPGNKPLYIDIKSNHPPCILRNVPDSINKRLQVISSNKEAFDTHSKQHQEALTKSGYKYHLDFNKKAEKKNKKPRKRRITGTIHHIVGMS